MRNVEIEVFSFSELSESAQQAAHQEWLEGNEDSDCVWDGELSDILKIIAEKTGVSLWSYGYDRCSYNYRINDLEMVMRPEFDSYNFEHDPMIASEPTGIRAGKIALEVYYDLVESKMHFGRSTKFESKPTFRYYEDRYLSLTEVSRPSAFTKVDDCFTGHCLSYAFPEALKASIRANYTNTDYTLEDHLKIAFNALFERIVGDYDEQFSFEAFDASYAYDNEYLANGKVFCIEEGA